MAHYLTFVLLEWLTVAAACAAVVHWTWAWPLALLVVGTRQHALAVLGHDAAHFTACRDRATNDVLATLTLWPLGMGLHGYRLFHFGHHMHVGTRSDTELRHQRRFPAKWSMQNLLPWRRAYLVVTDLLGAGWLEVLTVLIVARPRTLGDRLGPPLTIAALTALCLWLDYWQAPLLWFTALYTVFWASFRQRCLEEHVDQHPTRKRERAPALWQRVIYLPHNIWRHHAHHRWPATPPYLLKEF